MNEHDTDKLKQERSELSLLINKGVFIEVSRTVWRKKSGIIGLIGKRHPVSETLKFIINEPTLSTLDRISAEQVELGISEEALATGDVIKEAKLLTREHCRRMAKILALAILGEDYDKCIQTGGRIRYEHDDKKLEELTELFFVNVKPSRLLKYCIFINTISNLGDFTNSIRLMSAARTTMPIRVEENSVG